MAAMEVLPSSPISPCAAIRGQGKPTRRKKRTSKFASRIDSALSESEDSSAAKPRSDSGGRSSDASKPSRRSERITRGTLRLAIAARRPSCL